MPNYKLTDNLVNNLKSEARRLLLIPVAAVSADFPLTLEQVQIATIPADAREWIAGLQAMKADSVYVDATRCALIEESDEITHTVVLQMQLPRRVMYLWDTQIYSNQAGHAFRNRENNPDKVAQLPFDIDTLDEVTRTRFITWINTSTKQARLSHAAHHLIVEFLDNYCASTAELLARWNGLKILFDRQGDPWKSRIRELPHRNLRNWGWSALSSSTIALEWAAENEKRMATVDGLLAGASLMDTEMTPQVNKVVSASVLTWDGGP